MADIPQLGYMPSINLGGYVPAPAYRPGLGKEAAYQILASMLGKAGGNIIDSAMSPDLSGYAAQHDVAVPDAKWYQKPISPDQMTAMAGTNDLEAYRRSQTILEGARDKVAADQAGAITNRINTMTPAELAQLQAQTARINTMTPVEAAQGKAQTARIATDTAIAPYAAAARINNENSGALLQGTQAGNIKAQAPAQIAENQAQAGLANAQAGLVKQQVDSGKNPLDAAQRYQMWLTQVKAQILSEQGESMGKGMSGRGKRISDAIDTYISHNPVPLDGNISKWLSGLHQFVGTQK